MGLKKSTDGADGQVIDMHSLTIVKNCHYNFSKPVRSNVAILVMAVRIHQANKES